MIHTSIGEVTATNAIPWDYSAYIDPILRLQFICISGWWSFWIELGDFKCMHAQTFSVQFGVSITKCITIVLDSTLERMKSDFKWYLSCNIGRNHPMRSIGTNPTFSLLFSIQSTKIFLGIVTSEFSRARAFFTSDCNTSKMSNFEFWFLFFECRS